MPKRINSFGPTFISPAFVLLAAVAIDFDSPVRAACIEQAPRPVAGPAHVSVPSHVSVPYDYATCHSCHGVAAEQLLWTFRYDRAEGRKCWFLLDAAGHDVTAAHLRPGSTVTSTSNSTFWSKIESWWDNLNLMKTANAEPESSMPRSTPPRKQSDTVNANKRDSNNRAADRNNDEGRIAKRVSQTPKHEDERALFEEFMQWRERQKLIDTTLGVPSARQ